MSASVSVSRSVFTEERFQQTHGSRDPEPGAARLGPDGARTACVWLPRARLPILTWLPAYRPREWLLGDAVAGLTVGVLHIPQGMAFALLTSVAPVFGLYTSFFPVLLYLLLGTGRHISTGTFAVVSLMTGSVVEQLVPVQPHINGSSLEAADLEDQRIAVASAVALLSGLIMVCMFVLRLGFLSTYLSEPVVKAFTSAAAFHVAASQLQSMLGLRLPRHTGNFALFKTLASVLENLPQTNMAELLISLVCLAVLIPIKEINQRCRARLRTPIPVEILTVIVATGVAYSLSLDSTCDVQIVGHIPAGFPSPRVPALHVFPDIVADTFSITFVGYAVSVSLATIYADKHAYSIHPNQELLAHGISNAVSSLFMCFPSSATLATTSILESSGGFTQLSGLFTGLVVLLVLLRLGPLFYFLPKAVLACVNVTSLRPMFLQFKELPHLWRVSHMDFVVWVVTWVLVVVLNVDLGLLIGVVVSMVTVICRTQRVGCSVLGQASNTEIYRPIHNHNKCSEVPGLKILSYNGPIFYGNRSFFREEVSRLLGLTPERIHSLEKTQKALERRRRDTTITTVERDASFSSDQEFLKPDVQAVLMDCSSIIFVDVAGARVFIQVCIECQKVGLRIYLANCNESVLRILTSSGLMNYVNPRHIFVTVHDAVVYVQNLEETTPHTTTVWV